MDVNRGAVDALRNGLERRECLVREPYDKPLVTAQLDVAWRHISTLKNIRNREKKREEWGEEGERDTTKKLAPTIVAVQTASSEMEKGRRETLHTHYKRCYTLHSPV